MVLSAAITSLGLFYHHIRLLLSNEFTLTAIFSSPLKCRSADCKASKEKRYFDNCFSLSADLQICTTYVAQVVSLTLLSD